MKTVQNILKTSFFLFLIVSLSGLLGCKTLDVLTNDNQVLVDRLELYDSTVRWGALEKLYVFMKHSENTIIEIPQGLDNIRVVDYEVTVPASKLQDGRVIQSALITYVKKDEQRIKKLLDNQIWEKKDEESPWYRTNKIPAFK